MFKRKLRKNLLKLIDELENENRSLIEEIKIYKHDMVILLDNSRKDREKIKDLENNIELLTNNLTPKKREKLGISQDNSQ